MVFIMSKGIFLRMTVIMLVRFATQTFAYSTGSPASVCLSPYPHHQNSKYEQYMAPQPKETAPIYINTSSSVYGSSNNSINIIITNTGAPYIGILMLVRSKYGLMLSPLGSFLSCNSTSIKLLKAESISYNCVTHSDAGIKPTVIMCVWLPPAKKNYGDLEIVVSVIQSFETYWVDLTYPILFDNTSSIPVQCDPIFAPPLPVVVKVPSTNVVGSEFTVNNIYNVTQTFECGTTKNCLLYPPSCLSFSNCQFMVTVQQKSDGEVFFEIVAPLSGFFALAISQLDKLNHSGIVVICTSSSSTNVVSFSTGYIKPYYFSESIQRIFSARQFGVTSNWMGMTAKVCRFAVQSSFLPLMSSNGIVNISLTSPLHVFFGHGDTFPGTRYVQEHMYNPPKTQGTVILMSNASWIQYLSAFDYSQKIHEKQTKILELSGRFPRTGGWRILLANVRELPFRESVILLHHSR